jgi:activator of Hsp90 ATPase-like protein
MSSQLPGDCFLTIEKRIDIDAPLTVAFAAVLEQLGPANETPHGPMPMKLEAWPGGRWYRDLGNDAGHFWGHVQVIKPPTLLEIAGPLFMSYAAVSHVQYRLAEQGSGTRLTLTHTALGKILPAHREGVSQGWEYMLTVVKRIAGSRR